MVAWGPLLVRWLIAEVSWGSYLSSFHGIFYTPIALGISWARNEVRGWVWILIPRLILMWIPRLVWRQVLSWRDVLKLSWLVTPSISWLLERCRNRFNNGLRHILLKRIEDRRGSLRKPVRSLLESLLVKLIWLWYLPRKGGVERKSLISSRERVVLWLAPNIRIALVLRTGFCA